VTDLDDVNIKIKNYGNSTEQGMKEYALSISLAGNNTGKSTCSMSSDYATEQGLGSLGHKATTAGHLLP